MKSKKIEYLLYKKLGVLAFHLRGGRLKLANLIVSTNVIEKKLVIKKIW